MDEGRDWVRTRKKILQQVKSQVQSLLGPEPRDLTRYASTYKKEFQGRWLESTSQELLDRLSETRIAYGGDFHAYAQAQRSHLRILRDLVKQRSILLLLEIFESKDQEIIDSFMAGQMTEKEFVAAIQWDERWGFPWANYEPLISLARQSGIQVMALNRYYSLRSEDTLIKRDLHSAGIIAEAYRHFPKHLLYVIYGDLHVAPERLPRMVRKELTKLNIAQPNDVMVYLNSERLYFQLARKGRDLDVQVLRKGNDRFCVMVSPPWVKWQSYLLFLEHGHDKELIEAAEEGEEGEEHDLTPHVLHLITILLDELHAELESKDISVFAPGESGMENYLTRYETRDRKLLQRMVLENRSFFLPQGHVFYLARTSINHAAALCGQFLQSRFSGREEPLLNFPKDFRARIWVEALGFFCSKIVNHHRKAETLENMKTQLAGAKDRARETLLLAIDMLLSEAMFEAGITKPRRVFRPRNRVSFIDASKMLGSILGERMYRAYHAGDINRNNIIHWLAKNTSDSDFEEYYRLVYRDLKKHRGSTGPRRGEFENAKRGK